MESSPNFCSQCGASLSPDDAFCSQCGTSVRRSGESDSRRFDVGAADASGATRRSAFRRRVENLTVEGWEIEHDYGDRVVLVDRGFGSWGVHALLLLFTGGLGNVPYAWYHHSPGADRLELRADGTHRYVSDGSSGNRQGESSDSTRLTVGNVLFSFFCALAGLAILDGVASLPAFFVGVTLLGAALYAFPPTRERIRDRRSPTTFGWVRSTDETVVDAPDAPCTACSRPVGTGVERTFHETLYVAGFPITTDEQGQNRYCQSCASGDPFTKSDVDASGRETELEY